MQAGDRGVYASLSATVAGSKLPVSEIIYSAGDGPQTNTIPNGTIRQEQHWSSVISRSR
jgi:hypothetical protein